MALAPVLAWKTAHPPLSYEQPQRTGQSRAVHRKQVTQATLRDPAGERQSLEEGKLRSAHSGVSQLVVVQLRHDTRCPADVGTRTRKYPLRRVDCHIICIYIDSDSVKASRDEDKRITARSRA